MATEYRRTSVSDFSLANPAYAGAMVTFWLASDVGAKTTSKAPLYNSLAGADSLGNPQELDHEGKLQQPVYYEAPVIAEIDIGVGSHDTGVITPPYGGDEIEEAIKAGREARSIWQNVRQFFRRNPTGTLALSDNAATNQKLADMAQGTIKGRASGAGPGDPQDLSAAQVLTIINVTAGAEPNVIEALLEDTSPQLGGALDVNGFSIVTVSNGNIVLAPHGTGEVRLGKTNFEDAEAHRPRLVDYAVKVHSPSISSGALTLNFENGNAQSVTLDENVTAIVFQNPPPSGQQGKMTVKFTQDGTGSRTVAVPTGTRTSNGNAWVMTPTANAVDIIVFETQDGGTTYDLLVAGQDMQAP